MSQSTLSNDLEANDIDFFKKKFADLDTIDRQLKTWQALNYVQLKQRTSNPAIFNESFSNADQVKSQKYESIRYECIHYGMPRPHKYQTTGSRPNTVSNAVDCKCFYHYKWNVDHYAVIEEEERENSIISSSSSSGSRSLPDKPDQIDQPDLNDENAQDYLNFEVQKTIIALVMERVQK